MGAAYTQRGVLAKGRARILQRELGSWDAIWDWRGHAPPTSKGEGPPRGGDCHATPLTGDAGGAKGLPRGRILGCASGREPRVCRPPGAPGEAKCEVSRFWRMDPFQWKGQRKLRERTHGCWYSGTWDSGIKNGVGTWYWCCGRRSTSTPERGPGQRLETLTFVLRRWRWRWRWGRKTKVKRRRRGDQTHGDQSGCDVGK